MKKFLWRFAAPMSILCGNLNTSVIAQAPPIAKPPMAAKVPAAATAKPAIAKPAVVAKPTVNPTKVVSPTQTTSKIAIQQPSQQSVTVQPFGLAFGGTGNVANTNALTGINQSLNPGASVNGNLGLNGTNANTTTTNGLNRLDPRMQIQTGVNSNVGQQSVNSNLSTNKLATPQPLAGQGTGQLTQPLATNLNQGALNGATGTGGMSSVLQQRLNLSSSQLSQINQFQSAYSQELNQLRGRFQSDPQGTNSLITQAQQQLQQKVNSVLNPGQQQTLSQLTGVANPSSAASPLQNPASSTTATSNLASNATNLNAAASQSASNASLVSGTSNAASLGTNPLKVGNGGFLGISNPAVQQQLQLTPAQTSQLNKFQLDYIQQLRTLNGRFQTDPQGTLTLYQNALQQTNQQIESVLTPQQQQIYSSLTGAPKSLSSGSTSTTTSVSPF